MRLGNIDKLFQVLLDVIEKYAYGNPDLRSKLTSEMRLFRNAKGDFGRASAKAYHNVICFQVRFVNL